MLPLLLAFRAEFALCVARFFCLGIMFLVATRASLAEERPLGDYCNDAPALASALAWTTVSIRLSEASVEWREPYYQGRPANPSVWRRWTPSYSGHVVLKAERSGYALKLDVFRGRMIGELTYVAANRIKYGASAGAGAIPFYVVAGQTYSIRVQETETPGRVTPYATLTIQPRMDLAGVAQQRNSMAAGFNSFAVDSGLLGRANATRYNASFGAYTRTSRGYRYNPGALTSYGLEVLIIVGSSRDVLSYFRTNNVGVDP